MSSVSCLPLHIVLIFIGLFTATSCLSTGRSNTQGSSGVTTNAEAIRKYVNQYVEFGAFDGVVLVARGEEVVLHEAFGFADYSHMIPMEPQVRFRLASLSKQFTQVAIGRLVERGQLAFDSKVSKYLPDFPNGDKMTVLQLLDHTSGVKHTNQLDWMSMKEPQLLNEIIEGLSREPLDFEPGTQSSYSNGGYAVAAAIIEVASGRSFSDFIKEEFSERGYSSIGHEEAYEVVPFMAHRYAPASNIGYRVEATQYLVANRIGGGSIFGRAEDVFRFFRNTFRGVDMSREVYDTLFTMPRDGDTRITGRSPGALAQVYYDINDDLTVVTLSSNTAWPGGFNRDITALFRGEAVEQIPVKLVEERAVSGDELAMIVGSYKPDRFRWKIHLERNGKGIVYVQDEMRTAFRKTVDGSYYLPVWDWLCRFENGYQSFTCQQRDPSTTSKFVFARIE